jgi:4a-hydroxytetrahydrobiopterin dehydratase
MNWKEEEGRLVKEFEFKDFKGAIDFINKISKVSEEQNHHPEILLYSYNKLKVMVYTHDEDSITQKDYSLAEAIDLLM